jgi:hypothetical protein
MTAHVLLFIHGITPQAQPTAHGALYDAFWSGLQREQPSLTRAIGHIARVEWGNRLHPGRARPDELLSDAEVRAASLVDNERVRLHPGAHNILHPGPLGDWNVIPGLRLLVRSLREQLVQFGLADAIYYASQDGEQAVRAAVYGQVLAQLRPLRAAADGVMLHVVAHSLGVTVAHDFLYGLFGKLDIPDYLGQAASEEDKDDYLLWRERAGRRQLRFGSFVSMASQLPLFALRKQALVDRLAAGGVLDPLAIGLEPSGQTQWLIVYDVDDALGFATRELYGDRPELRQVQVDVGDTPINAHMDYWTNERVIQEAAQLMAGRAAG